MKTGTIELYAGTPSTMNRYEAKYTVPLALIDPIVRFIAPYCEPDRHSLQSPDRFYTINSLYFDTPRFHLLRQRIMKVENRFNMRIRSYGDAPQPPWFFEIKQRQGDIVRKSRARVASHDLTPIFESGHIPVPDHEGSPHNRNLDLFLDTVRRYDTRPVVLVQYRRQAFNSIVDEYARVTFDIALRYMPQNSYLVVPDEDQMSSCDLQTCFDPGCCVILELKCYTSFVPLWMIDLVRYFELHRRGFSKYAFCVKPIISRFDRDGLQRRSRQFVANGHNPVAR